MVANNGSHRGDILGAISWMLDQPEFKEVAKDQGSIGFAIKGLRTALHEKGAQPLVPDRFKEEALKGVIREEVMKEFREKILPMAEAQIRAAIQTAQADQPPIPIDVTQEQEEILKEKAQLEKEKAQLKRDQQAVMEKLADLEKEIASFSEVSQYCEDEAGKYSKLCAEIQAVITPIGGVKVLAGLVENVLQAKLDTADKNVLSKAAKEEHREYSDGMTWQELNSLNFDLVKQNRKSPVDFAEEVKSKKFLRKKLAKGITSKLGLTWEEILSLANNSTRLIEIKKKITAKRREAQNE